jgi:hypothetical protein
MFEFRGSADQTVCTLFRSLGLCEGIDRLELQTLHVVTEPLDFRASIATGFDGFTLADFCPRPCFLRQFEASLQSCTFAFKFIHTVFCLLQPLAVARIDDQGTSSLHGKGILPT